MLYYIDINVGGLDALVQIFIEPIDINTINTCLF